MSNQAQVLDEQYEKDYKTIKGFLNTINDNVRSLGDNGYDTKDIYVIYDMLRYEILSDSNIRKLNENGMTDDIIAKLNTFNGLINDLTKDYIKNKKSLDEANERIRELSEDKPVYNKKSVYIGCLEEELVAVALLLAPILISVPLEKKIIKHTFRAPKVTEYTIDSTGKLSEEIRYDREHTDTLTIEEYTEKNNSGFRLQKKYVIDKGAVTDAESLDSIDLTGLQPEFTSLIPDSELGDVPSDSFRVGRFEVENKDEMGKTTDVAYSEFIFLTAAIALCDFLIYGLLLENLYIEDFNDTIALFTNIINFAKYKIVLKKYLKELKVTDKEKVELEKIVNTLCNRIDKTIVKCTEELANVEYMRKIQIEKEAALKESKFKEIKREEEQKKQEQTEKVKQLIGALSKEIKVLEGLDDSDCEELYHSIGITENLLFEKVDDHFVIRSKFIPLLRFLDLSLISFDNVDIRYVDFRGTNATIRPQNIYNKDASYAKFDDNNLPDFSNYKGVNLTGSELDENETTLVNKENAIMSDETVFKRRLNK